jgi:hypothetical protein
MINIEKAQIYNGLLQAMSRIPLSNIRLRALLSNVGSKNMSFIIFFELLKYFGSKCYVKVNIVREYQHISSAFITKFIKTSVLAGCSAIPTGPAEE